MIRRLEDLLTHIFHVMERHHRIARVALANVPAGPNAVAVVEHLIALLRVGVVADRKIAWSVDVVFLFINATAYEAAIYVETGIEEVQVDESLHAAFAKLDPVAYPNFTSMLDLLTAGSGEERFKFGLRLMIEGLLHVEPPPIPRGTSPIDGRLPSEGSV